jgi:hypothetical protein
MSWSVAVADNHEAAEAKIRRDTLRAEHLCINGAHHGPPVVGAVRCAWCVTVHRLGVAKARELAAESPVNPQPTPKVGRTYRARREHGAEGARLVLP